MLFGSITAAMVADAVKAETGVEIDRKRLEMGSAIKTAGAHTVALSIYRDIKVELALTVGDKKEEEPVAEEAVEAAEVAEEAATEEAAE